MDFGHSFVFELTRTIVDEALFRRLFNETFAPWIRRTPRPDVQWEQLRSTGQLRQPFEAGPFAPWGELHVVVEIPRYGSRQDGRWAMELFDGLANQTDYHYAAIHLFKIRKDPMLNLTSREKIAPETLRQRREIFHGILKA